MAKKVNEEVLGYAEFGAFLHRDNGGKARVAAYTSVNKPLSVESHDETTKIASRRFLIKEVETAKLDGNKFYNKDVWNEQEGGDNQTGHYTDNKNVSDDENNSTPKDGMTPLQVLKNFVDNIAADVRNHTWIIVAVGAIAAAALVLAIVK